MLPLISSYTHKVPPVSEFSTTASQHFTVYENLSSEHLYLLIAIPTISLNVLIHPKTTNNYLKLKCSEFQKTETFRSNPIQTIKMDVTLISAVKEGLSLAANNNSSSSSTEKSQFMSISKWWILRKQ